LATDAQKITTALETSARNFDPERCGYQCAPVVRTMRVNKARHRACGPDARNQAGAVRRVRAGLAAVSGAIDDRSLALARMHRPIDRLARDFAAPLRRVVGRAASDCPETARRES